MLKRRGGRRSQDGGPLNNKTRDLFKRWLRSGPWLTCRTERGSPFLVSGSSPELLEPPDTCFGDVENFPPVMRHVSEGVGVVEQCQTKRWNWVTVRNLVATQIRYMRGHGITAGSWAARILVTDTLPRRVEILVLRILIPPHRIYHFLVRKVLEKRNTLEVQCAGSDVLLIRVPADQVGVGVGLDPMMRLEVSLGKRWPKIRYSSPKITTLSIISKVLR